ncbi:nuclear GTP-binding protein nug1 [Exophiala xenobiotica]|uniref:Nuclear GTP-binding protein nug1 n=1 Tax=Vermiconidia calcicola TaxID=1690605 RepID=A0AAV9Q3F0_9PEZI|nr:nuclear GTP-binding protein nug1 [Exophiala xenobiotica]KAK5534512.1 nuclear GTP-binding protein nug1 [Vermiconidia calcicola]KAK5544606.1 nuclear GTP-binding protein nug1 [Chaetothyriales sp. CCFEE 6169]KAK5198346.1 nuclear GTP-binding protein nug1 [Exophiala xenobiotica]KAK5207447.1 nuclear GTP-binding protein nug1 [Exophiala xenobiotica]
MVKSFSKSKRTPVRLRHKIEKASAAKQRKQRKEDKKNPQWKSRLKKDPGIPNLFPFKEKLLEEIEEKKRQRAENAQRLRDAAKGNKKGNQGDTAADDDDMDEDDLMEEEDGLSDEDMDDDDEVNDNANPLAALVASAQARAAEYDGGALAGDFADDDGDVETGGVRFSEMMAADHRNPDSSRRAFDKIFKQVLDAADVVLYVLDARDPESTRSREVERQIMSAEGGSKRLILVLNKIDLVPPPVLKGWLTHLRRYFPTIPLRASTPASNAQTFDHKQLTLKATSETLLRSLKTYAASKQLKRSISVGVIGYPNVGKSSVINALTSRLNKGTQSFACPVGSEAGVTTSLREVKIDSKLKILDSPGIVFPSTVEGEDKEGRQRRKAEHEARLVLLNALPPSQITDPIPAVTLLLERLSTSEALFAKLLSHYGVVALGPFGQGDRTTDFLVQVARKRGRLGRGGVPNLYAAAMTVITDWRDGRIQGWVEAPVLKVADDTQMVEAEEDKALPTGVDRKEIVKEWAAEFKIEGLWGDGKTDSAGNDAMQVES